MSKAEFVINIWSFIREVTNDKLCFVDELDNVVKYRPRTGDIIRSSKHKVKCFAFVLDDSVRRLHSTISSERGYQKYQILFPRHLRYCIEASFSVNAEALRSEAPYNRILEHYCREVSATLSGQAG